MSPFVKSKIISQAGESIGETLVALLIAALALVMLAGAITTATRLVTTSTNSIKNYYSGNNEIEKRSDSAKIESAPSLTIESIAPNDGISCSGITVTVYKNKKTNGSEEIVAYD